MLPYFCQNKHQYRVYRIEYRVKRKKGTREKED